MPDQAVAANWPQAPLNKDTIVQGASISDMPENVKNDGLNYQDAVLCAYFNNSERELAVAGSDWPCTDTYPVDEVEATRQAVRTTG